MWVLRCRVDERGRRMALWVSDDAQLYEDPADDFELDEAMIERLGRAAPR